MPYKDKRPEAQALVNAWQRCTNPNAPKYALYGGRGIKFLIESADALIAAIGPRPEGTYPSGKSLWSLNRIDNDGDYVIGNVEWTTQDKQCNNTSRSNPTHCPKGHEYTDANVYKIPTRAGNYTKRCRICHSQSETARQATQEGKAKRKARRMKKK
jgi:hypothetical protein